MKRLLIGGSHDGEVVDVKNDVHYVKMTVKEEIKDFDSTELADYYPAVEVYSYEVLTAKAREFIIFRHDDLPVEEMLKKLILNYRPINLNRR